MFNCHHITADLPFFLRQFFLGFCNNTPSLTLKCTQQGFLFYSLSYPQYIDYCQAYNSSINLTSELFPISQFWYIAGAQNTATALMKGPAKLRDLRRISGSGCLRAIRLFTGDSSVSLTWAKKILSPGPRCPSSNKGCRANTITDTRIRAQGDAHEGLRRSCGSRGIPVRKDGARVEPQ